MEYELKTKSIKDGHSKVTPHVKDQGGAPKLATLSYPCDGFTLVRRPLLGGKLRVIPTLANEDATKVLVKNIPAVAKTPSKEEPVVNPEIPITDPIPNANDEFEPKKAELKKRSIDALKGNLKLEVVKQKLKMPNITIFNKAPSEKEQMEAELKTIINQDGYYNEILPEDHGEEYIHKEKKEVKGWLIAVLAAITILGFYLIISNIIKL